VIQRGFVVVAGFVLLMSSAVADDTTASPPSPDVAKCISDNAANTEQAIANLTEAVNYLVGDVCAVPVAAESQKKMLAMMERQQDQWKKLCDEEKSKPAGKKSSALDPCQMDKVGFLSEPQDTQASIGSASPSELALAADLLLKIRISKSKSEAGH
jgi:hypothetical protein